MKLKKIIKKNLIFISYENFTKGSDILDNKLKEFFDIEIETKNLINKNYIENIKDLNIDQNLKDKSFKIYEKLSTN